MQSLTLPLIVLTDYSAIKQIVAKKTLDTSSIDRANRRLVIALIYLSKYDIEVYYLLSKKNFIPDAFSRLLAEESD